MLKISPGIKRVSIVPVALSIPGLLKRGVNNVRRIKIFLRLYSDKAAPAELSYRYIVCDAGGCFNPVKMRLV